MTSDRSDEKVEKIFRGLANLPSLPEAIQRMVELSESDATPRQFADLISTDQGLTVKVLKLVNSAFYGMSQSIASVHHATTLLGTKTLKSLILSVSVMQLFRKGCEGFDPPRYWRHSVATAVAAQRLGAVVREELADHLYVAGLLHDTGTALLAEHLPREYAFALRLYRDTCRELPEIEREIFGVSHACVGARLVKKWRLPGAVCEAVGLHESADEHLSETEPVVREIVDLLRIAEVITANAGCGFLDGSDRDPVADASAEGAVDTEPETRELRVPQWVRKSPAELIAAVGDLEAEVARIEAQLGAAMSSSTEGASWTASRRAR